MAEVAYVRLVKIAAKADATFRLPAPLSPDELTVNSDPVRPDTKSPAPDHAYKSHTETDGTNTRIPRD